ncbi:MAG TPA: HAD family phosphatase [Bacteroidia bacterium]|jgi:epoxide hydrolase-like predicted phosphatase|nr:HAD family phosphatase [Bacteroidia bacterium]
MQGIQNVIFDLGGVIINLDATRTISAFNRISQIPFQNIYTQAKQDEIFSLLDTGKISTLDFLNEVKRQIRYTGPIEDLLAAWNAMLLDVPEERLEALVEMKHNYNTYLLSNTCEPHIEAFEMELENEHGIKNFDDYFDKVYYSCRIGMRKPDKEIFEFVLNQNKLKPEETIFIDDSPQHVKAAGELGINAYLLQKNMSVNDLLRQLKLL